MDDQASSFVVMAAVRSRSLDLEARGRVDADPNTCTSTVTSVQAGTVDGAGSTGSSSLSTTEVSTRRSTRRRRALVCFTGWPRARRRAARRKVRPTLDVLTGRSCSSVGTRRSSPSSEDSKPPMIIGCRTSRRVSNVVPRDIREGGHEHPTSTDDVASSWWVALVDASPTH